MKLRRAIALPAAAAIAVLAGCDGSSIAGPGSDGGSGQNASFTRSITVDELETQTTDGATRLDIRLSSGELVARRVEVDESDEVGDDEQIEARVTAIESSGGEGTVTFALGDGFQVSFDGSTRFEEDDGGSDRNLTLSEFTSRLQGDLDAGRRPVVEAKRRPGADPQAPDDATFLARELELDDDDDDRKIEINVDADNFERNDSPPPAAWITVLGLRVEIRDGETRLRRQNDDDRDEAEFESFVASADVEGNEVTLRDGTVVRIVGGTEIDSDDDSDDEELGSVQEVADALDAGRSVEAEGEGMLESRDPRTVVAVEAEFEIEDDDGRDGDGDDDGDAPAGSFEFEDGVASVDTDAGSFTLDSGQEVRMTADTNIESDGDLFSLEAVADAVAADRPVRAEGDAESSGDGPWTAFSVKFEVDD